MKFSVKGLAKLRAIVLSGVKRARNKIRGQTGKPYTYLSFAQALDNRSRDFMALGAKPLASQSARKKGAALLSAITRKSTFTKTFSDINSVSFKKNRFVLQHDTGQLDKIGRRAPVVFVGRVPDATAKQVTRLRDIEEALKQANTTSSITAGLTDNNIKIATRNLANATLGYKQHQQKVRRITAGLVGGGIVTSGVGSLIYKHKKKTR
ncbi:MAG: hypothetical protein Q8Q65_01495 [bacterium]|nr:hypothetical protein [bacterium]